ncbi:MAG: hypothetical protein QXU18_05725 [Thermoplasmatales archaeon]
MPYRNALVAVSSQGNRREEADTPISHTSVICQGGFMMHIRIMN